MLGAPTVDITNINTTNLTTNDNIEVYKQEVVLSCRNMISVAENALQKHPKLQKVTINEHAPRHDKTDVDPTRLKPNLAMFANATLAELLRSSSMNDRITIGKHSLDCTDYQIQRKFRNDGVHFNEADGKDAYTNSLIKIFHSIFPKSSSISSSSNSSEASYHDSCPQALYQQRMKSKLKTKSSSISSSSNSSEASYHDSCPQAMYQQRMKLKLKTAKRTTATTFTVPIHNRFDVLGN